MRHSIQGNRLQLEYRVVTPFKNGHLDHIFADKTKAITFADESAVEFGLALLFDHHTNEIMHISCDRIQFGKNAKQFDYTGDVKFKTSPCPTNWLNNQAK